MIKRHLRRILLVEDDPDIQDVTTLLLSTLGGYEVHACASALEGLQKAQAFDPDLILLDFLMPGLDGQGAFEAFRQTPATAATPVIFITARAQPRAIVEYRQLGSLGVIPKPFDPETLAETIQGMWDRDQAARLTESLREDLTALRRRYAAAFPESLCAIQSAAASLQENEGDREVAASLYDMAHRLAGSAAIYGFPAVTEAAQRIGRFATEHPADRWLPKDAPSFLRLVAALVAALEQPVQRAPAHRAT
jgi:two-component system, OmpR family, response regulator